MTLIYSVILCLLFKACSCELQCVKEPLNDKEFNLDVDEHVRVEFGECFQIRYKVTFPTNKVTSPYYEIWFEGDPQNIKSRTVVHSEISLTDDVFRVKAIPEGEHEYGFKLEWKCNQTYIFPKKVRVSVAALTRGPEIHAPPMMHGEIATLTCIGPTMCSHNMNYHWEWTRADGWSTMLTGVSGPMSDMYGPLVNTVDITPTADDHNTNITCVVSNNGVSVAKTTFTLSVKVPPKILNDSKCMVEGELVVCVCISWGNPRAPITWPLTSLTDFSVISLSGVDTVKSTLTMPASASDTSVKCIGTNELGRAEREIPLQNYTGNSWPNYELDSNPGPVAVLWILTGVSLSLNLCLLITLIICSCNRARENHQKELGAEMNTYACLNQTDGQVYSVIS